MRIHGFQRMAAGRRNGLWRSVAAATLLALAGCAGGDGVGIGIGAPLSASRLAPPAGGVDGRASEEIEALLGAGFGTNLGSGDLDAAYRAQIRALDESRAGTSVTWTNPRTGNRGEIVPGPVYVVNNLECRDFSHTVETPAGRQVRRGAACRRSDGSWQSIA